MENSVDTIVSAQCRACDVLVTYTSTAPRLTYRQCPKCGVEMVAPGNFLHYRPKARENEYIKVLSAKYGHQLNSAKRIDVTKAVQDRVDAASGHRLDIGMNEPLLLLFGEDPCEGMDKVLLITVNTCKRTYEFKYTEHAGLLTEPVRIVADEYRRLGITPEMKKLTILAATIGERVDPRSAVDVTRIVAARVEDSGERVLVFDTTENLAFVFPDPCPGDPKLLIVRYMMYNNIGEVRIPLSLHKEGFNAAMNVFIEVPTYPPSLKVIGAQYGHPNNPIQAYDVTNIVQGRCDLRGGEWFEVMPEENLQELFGDPYPGTTKTLTIHYDFMKRSRKVVTQERHGYLARPVRIIAPQAQPQLLVQRATFVHADDRRPVLDITDIIKNRIDVQGGDRLEFKADENVLTALGLNDKGDPLDDAAIPAKDASMTTTLKPFSGSADFSVNPRSPVAYRYHSELHSDPSQDSGMLSALSLSTAFPLAEDGLTRTLPAKSQSEARMFYGASNPPANANEKVNDLKPTNPMTSTAPLSASANPIPKGSFAEVKALRAGKSFRKGGRKTVSRRIDSLDFVETKRTEVSEATEDLGETYKQRRIKEVEKEIENYVPPVEEDPDDLKFHLPQAQEKKEMTIMKAVSEATRESMRVEARAKGEATETETYSSSIDDDDTLRHPFIATGESELFSQPNNFLATRSTTFRMPQLSQLSRVEEDSLTEFSQSVRSELSSRITNRSRLDDTARLELATPVKTSRSRVLGDTGKSLMDGGWSRTLPDKNIFFSPLKSGMESTGRFSASTRKPRLATTLFGSSWDPSVKPEIRVEHEVKIVLLEK